MKLAPTPIAGVFIAGTDYLADHRGRFGRLFCSDELLAAHAGRPIVQVNHSVTRAVGSVRGMHYQVAPAGEAKWVRCLRGRVFDVAVDLRRGSPTLKQWFGVELSADAGNALFLPEGVAHGFQVLERDSEMLYLHTAAYAPAHEAGLRWDDPAVGIDWPLPVRDLSTRDAAHPFLPANFEGIDA
jgi:dTDP-4-dehydrorhamnose 3,5-epimerase